MARDIKIIWNNDLLEGDFELDYGDLVRDEGLTTAVLISLFTDARADEDDEIDNKEDKRGWWANNIFNRNFGSKIWQLERAKTTNETIERLKQYIKECLQWMIDDEVVKKIDVFVERSGIKGNDRLLFEIILYQTDGNTIALKFDDLWKAQFNIII